MALLYKKKDNDGVEHAWFESSNVQYSKVNLKEQKEVQINVGGLPMNTIIMDLEIVFHNGKRYKYKNVQLHDYQAFLNTLSREDDKSTGKIFHKIIKPYQFEKLSDVDLTELEELKWKFAKEDVKSDNFKKENNHGDDNF